MEIKHSAPRSLDVEKLMYIGDSELPTGTFTTGQKLFFGASAIAVCFAIFGKTKKQKLYGLYASLPLVVTLAI